ncbi:hypothetical protein K456DRAFT_36962 [Colletotrichum gloeosporioides 23]|nr:hypothetical protein K456DRAFT_36962 [Colletotrichum gloeosporioides 23]
MNAVKRALLSARGDVVDSLPEMHGYAGMSILLAPESLIRQILRTSFHCGNSLHLSKDPIPRLQTTASIRSGQRPCSAVSWLCAEGGRKEFGGFHILPEDRIKTVFLDARMKQKRAGVKFDVAHYTGNEGVTRRLVPEISRYWVPMAERQRPFSGGEGGQIRLKSQALGQGQLDSADSQSANDKGRRAALSDPDPGGSGPLRKDS